MRVPKKLRGKHTILVDNQIIRWRKKRKAAKLVVVAEVKFFEERSEPKPAKVEVKSFNFFGDETVE